LKLVTYHLRTSPCPECVGALVQQDSRVVPLKTAAQAMHDTHGESARALTSASEEWFASMLSLIRRGEPALDCARRAVEFALTHDSSTLLLPRDTVRLLAPLPNPVMLRCCSVFKGHASNCRRTLEIWRTGQVPTDIPLPPAFFEIPGYYKGNSLSLIGPETPIEFPPEARKLDFELELAAIIGRAGRDVPVADFQRYIFGYSIFNDASARHPQLEEMRLGTGPNKSKDFDTGNVLGPCIVTPDEFNPHTAQAIARVNGEEWGRGDASDMAHSWADILHYRSHCERLFPGEIITSGCFSRCSGIEHDRFLQPGDRVDLEIPGIGILSNPIARATT
jgi:2-keto-4-pentenoate hydratase/2-oxohepta-3-ene-1,7-dioic acid hydratase in catechol pathway